MNLRAARAGNVIRLGQLLGRGGEGEVFAVEGHADEVAKVYSTTPDPRKVAKLEAMVAAANQDLLRIAAWPKDLLTDEKKRCRGFVMPRLAAQRDVHELYSPKSRADSFPAADFRFLCHVGVNIARAFAAVHEHGHVIGDVNHANLLVGSDGTVMLLDCDSFQVESGAEIFTCDVGVPLFTAPELQGKVLRNLPRNQNHDRFGLAVLLFHVLYMGRHQFAGRYSGPGDMPIERAITEYRFAYGPDRATYGMERPPGTVPLEAMGAEVASLFVKAFGRPGNIEGRPEATNWIRSVGELKAGLRSCSSASWHHYPGHLPSCLWCGIESATSVRLFGQPIAAPPVTGIIDVATIWEQIVRIEAPGPDPPLPSERPWVPPLGFEPPRTVLRTVRKLMGALLVCCGFAACTAVKGSGGWLGWLALMVVAGKVWPTVSDEERRSTEFVLATARGAWEKSLARWRREASSAVFAAKLAELGTVKNELSNLPNERTRRMTELEGAKESSQLHRYLDRFRIDRAKIKGIGPSRTAMLEAYGIETAADVRAEDVLAIQGFGESLTNELLQWQQQHALNFRFNPNEPVDPKLIGALDSELDRRRQQLVKKLHEGPVVLERLGVEIRSARLRLMPTLEREWDECQVARIRREAL